MALVTPMAGNAMPWWWDTYIDKNNLWPHWEVLARFARGVDRRRRDIESVRSTVGLGGGAKASLQGLVSPAGAVLWIYDRERITDFGQEDRPLLAAERPVRLEGMLGGTFRVEVWDPWTGEILRRVEEKTADGVLTFALPPCRRDVAVKAVKLGSTRLRLRW